jgi:hypothetical protein
MHIFAYIYKQVRFKVITGSLFLIGLVITSCQKTNNVSVIPAITFKSFQATGPNSATLQINFTDGDGDIGYPSQDVSAPPNLWIKYLYFDTAGTKKYIGIYNIADSATFDSVYFVYNIPYITPAGKDKALNGVIQIAMTSWYLNPYNSLDSLKVEYEIWLFDRAGHKSNVITSPVIYPSQY